MLKKPFKSNNRILKPNYQWIPKVLNSKFSKDPIILAFDIPEISSYTLFDKEDMTWAKVPCVAGKGQPSFKMDWVPKAI